MREGTNERMNERTYTTTKHITTLLLRSRVKTSCNIDWMLLLWSMGWMKLICTHCSCSESQFWWFGIHRNRRSDKLYYVSDFAKTGCNIALNFLYPEEEALGLVRTYMSETPLFVIFSRIAGDRYPSLNHTSSTSSHIIQYQLKNSFLYIVCIGTFTNYTL